MCYRSHSWVKLLVPFLSTKPTQHLSAPSARKLPLPFQRDLSAFQSRDVVPSTIGSSHLVLLSNWEWQVLFGGDLLDFPYQCHKEVPYIWPWGFNKAWLPGEDVGSGSPLPYGFHVASAPLTPEALGPVSIASRTAAVRVPVRDLSQPSV